MNNTPSPAKTLDFTEASESLALADLLYGNRKGYALIKPGEREANGDLNIHTPQWFAWPAQREEWDEAIREADAKGLEVFISPYVWLSKSQRKGNAHSPRVIHCDIDGPADELAIKRLRALSVASGTPGHRHVYLLLDQEVTDPDLHEALCRLLGWSIAKDHKPDTKFLTTDLLRPPGTHNHKTTPPLPVRLRNHTPRPYATASDALEALLPPGVRGAWDKEGGDRSTQAYALVREVYKAGLDKIVAREVIKHHTCSGHYNDDEHLSEDVARLYGKAKDEGLRSTPPEAEDFEAKVAKRIEQLEVDRIARARLRAQDRPAIPPTRGREWLAGPPPAPEPYLIEGIMPVNGRTLIAAQEKAGKTTLVHNLARSLITGEPFLDTYRVNVGKGLRVALLDFEMPEDSLWRELNKQGLAEHEGLCVKALDGVARSFDLLDRGCFNDWVDNLKEDRPDVVVLDCLRPVIDALGLSEDKDGSKILQAFRELCTAVGASESIAVHHMGHSSERARGDSGILGWTTATWKVLRDDKDTRYISGYGRRVNFPETALVYEDGRLSLGIGNRREAALDDLIPMVVKFIENNPGCSQNSIEGRGKDYNGPKVQGEATRIREAIRRAKEMGLIHVLKKGNANLHFPGRPEAL